MKAKIRLLFLLSLLSGRTWGQLSVSYASPSTAASTLTGSNVSVSGATLTGSGLQLGTFSGGSSSIGISSGIVLTTGDASLAAQGNTSDPGQQIPLSTPSGITDGDLALLGGFSLSTIKDAAIFEFDFTATGNLAQFEYVFASDEYLNYSPQPCPDVDGNVCDFGTYNDLFGFFISGPGISGPFSGGAENIALVPSTTDYVGVRTVNLCFNSSYFNDNDCTTARPYCLTDCNHPAEPWPDFVYDGFTDVFVAKRTIQCTPGSTYHLKIAIANVGDRNFDAAVFLKANSLTSNFSLPPIIASPATVCEGQPFNLTISSNSSWNYEWSTGQNGVGLTTVTPTASLGTNTYSVNVTNNDGCELTQTVDVNVHPLANLPPNVNGVDNSGVYDIFMQAGQNYCFSIPSFDAANEAVNMTYSNDIPDMSFSASGTQQIGSFCWQPGYEDIGDHTFQIQVCDNNVCGVQCQTYTFTVHVACDFCPVDIYYENRSQSTIPLPAETKAARYIYAGTSVDPSQTDGPVTVSVGETVDFRAGLNIFLELGFDAVPGSNFSAFIEPGTCVEDCEDCCLDWTGFTIDEPLPNVFTPNGDGINDVWYAGDIDNPYCAFNAQEFELHIFNRWGNEVYTLTEQDINPEGSYSCCPFKAPSPDNPTPYPDHSGSSIYWDGGSETSDGPYYIILILRGCGHEQSYTGSTQLFKNFVLDPNPPNSQSNAPGGMIFPDQPEYLPDNQNSEIFVSLVPNPARNKFSITGVTNGGITLFERIQVLNQYSEVLIDYSNFSSGDAISIDHLSSGLYWVKMFIDGNIFVKPLIKQ